MQRERDSELTAAERIVAPLERDGIDTFMALAQGVSAKRW